jgi:hypothetical protein
VAVAVGVGVGVGSSGVAVAVAVAVGVGVGVGVGTTSSFVIVPVPSVSEIVALRALLRWTVKSSSASMFVSPLTFTVICIVVSAGSKIRVPVFD